MANERMYPLLPCADIDESIAFYEHLGFKRTYRQLRPNPSGVVALNEMQIHLFGMDGYDPAGSYGSVIITVPDPDNLYRDFAAGLRKAYGKLPIAGIPRILRPRKKYGTVRGFSVVDPGGNWLRIFKLGETDEQENAPGKAEGLAQVVLVAARLGDARGDVALALKTLETGLARFPDAPPEELAKAQLYVAELAIRNGNPELARSAISIAPSLELNDSERAALADDFDHVKDLLSQ